MSDLILTSDTKSALQELIPMPFHAGESRLIIGDGRFSIFHIIEYILENINSPKIDLVTWTVGEDVARRFCRFCAGRTLYDVRFIVDRAAFSVKNKSMRILTDVFGKSAIRAIRNHAKLYLIYPDFIIESSANFNRNFRVETFRISRSTDLLTQCATFVDSVFESFPPPEMRGTAERFDLGSLRRVLPRRVRGAQVVAGRHE